MTRKILIYGASGHGKVIADIALRNGYEEVMFYDDDQNKTFIGEYPILHELPQGEYDVIIGIGDNATREKISARFDKDLAVLIHPDAIIGRDVTIGPGSVVMARAVINPGTTIGKGVIVNTCASLDHDNIVGDFTHVSVAAHTAGTVHIGKRVFLGMGSLVINNITIADDITVGADSLVIRNIDEKGTYAGSPVRKIK